MPERRVRLVRIGPAVRIPREFELPGEEAVMRRVGGRLILKPAPSESLLEVLARLEPLAERLPTVADRPPRRVKL